MTLEEFLPLLECVTARGTRWSTRCPAHPDKYPSLSVTAGERAILLKCWAGCSVDEICSALHIRKRDLFFDTLDIDPRERRRAAAQRARERAAKERILTADGLTIDAMKAAEDFIRSRTGIDISKLSDATLSKELDALGDAYQILERESLWTA